jgi:streptomycin 6-kinase
MDIPEYFLQKASCLFGEPGAAWARELPSLLDRCVERWQLSECRPIDALSVNLVCYAQSRQYGQVVLKIQGPHTERYTEITALQLYAGRHACRLHALEPSIPAMLLERITPGTCLKTLRDKDEQLRIGVEMIAGLPIPIGNDHGLPHYFSWLENASQKVAAAFLPDPTLKDLLAAAHRFYEEMEPDCEQPVLLHGDLHHENILRKGGRDWVAIDPQGVVGAAFLESGRFLQNHVIHEGVPIRPDETARAITVVAQGLGQPWQRIARTLYILHFLSICWTHEVEARPWVPDIEKQQCLDLIALIRRQ